MLIVGIDPGLNGALATVRDERLISVLALPTVPNGSNGLVKRHIDPYALGALLRGVRDQANDDIMVVFEHIQARLGDGAQAAFSFGNTYGCIRSAIALLRLKSAEVTPQVWKSHFGLSSDKKQSIAMASTLFPDHKKQWPRVKDDGKAEAALIALWGWGRYA